MGGRRLNTGTKFLIWKETAYVCPSFEDIINEIDIFANYDKLWVVGDDLIQVPVFFLFVTKF